MNNKGAARLLCCYISSLVEYDTNGIMGGFRLSYFFPDLKTKSLLNT